MLAPDAISPWLTLKQAADTAQCGQRLLRRAIAKGQLRAARIGGRGDIRIHRDWLTDWLERLAEPVEINPRIREVRR
jgi:excisionase family DNA binding protein